MVNAVVLEAAAGLAGAHGLRAYDSVQLATAKLARDIDAGCDTFAAFDRQMRSAATIERFVVLPA